MLTKNQVKFIRSLHSKKGRETHRQFIAEGSKLVLEAAAGPFSVVQVCAVAGWAGEHAARLKPFGIIPEIVLPGEMERISALSSPGPVLAVLRMKAPAPVPQPGPGELSLVLDDIRDPGNLGTIIRIADWFGIRRVVCSDDTADLYNPKVIQSTMGSFNRVEVFYTDLPAFLAGVPSGTEIYGTFLEGKNLYAEKWSAGGIIVIGNEGRGISPAVEKFVTAKINIPSYAFEEKGEDHAESLNAAIAAAVVCAEFRRQSNHA